MIESLPEQSPKPEVAAEQHEQVNFVLDAINRVKQLFVLHKNTEHSRFADYHGLPKPGRISGTVLHLPNARPDRFVPVKGIALDSGYEDSKAKHENFGKVHGLEKPLRVGGSLPATVLAQPGRFVLVRGKRSDV